MEKIKTVLCFLCLFVMQINLCSQTVVLSGTVKDTYGEYIIGASIQIDYGQFGVSTNNYGFFSIKIPTGQHTIITRYIGYKADTLLVTVEENKDIGIVLESSALHEVIISAVKSTQENQINTFILPLKILARIPSISGEQDILKAMIFTPGVANGTEGTVGLFVRGGTPDQNLILLDGAVVYNPAHLFGFLSVFNPDALNKVELIKGNGPARYGGRTSSVLNISMKDGNQNKVTGSFGIGTIASRGLIEGPLYKKKGSFMIAGRAAYLGLLNSLAENYSKNRSGAYTGYNMIDFNAKLTYPVSTKSTLSLSTYNGVDAIEGYSRDSETSYYGNRLKWGNLTTTARLTSIVSPRLFLKNILINSNFNYKNGLEITEKEDSIETKAGFVSRSSVRSTTFRSEADFYMNSKYTLRFGAEISRYWFTPRNNLIFTNTLDSSSTEALVNRSKGLEYVGYIENEFAFTKRVGINIGLRLDHFITAHKGYFMPEPRVQAHWTLRDNKTTFRGSFSGGQQCLHLLSNASLGFQNDVWVPITRDIRPQRVWQGAIGVASALSKWNMDWSVDLFYKKLLDQIEYLEGSTNLTSLTKNWFDLVATNGIGYSKGMEFGLSKIQGRFTGLFAYTWSNTTRQFDALNDGKTFPFSYDYTHNLNTTVNYEMNKKWSISGTWAWHTGAAISFPSAIVNDTYGSYWYIYKERNNARLPDYMRGDLGFVKTTTTEKGRIKTFSIGIYNITNRKNPLTARLLNVPTSIDNKIVYKSQIHIQGFIPIIPSVSYGIKF
jgi:hypothetical protein